MSYPLDFTDSYFHLFKYIAKKSKLKHTKLTPNAMVTHLLLGNIGFQKQLLTIYIIFYRNIILVILVSSLLYIHEILILITGKKCKYKRKKCNKETTRQVRHIPLYVETVLCARHMYFDVA